MSVSRMNTILAVDSSTNILRIGLRFGGDRLVKQDTAVEKSHGQIIMLRIESVLKSGGIRPVDLEGIVVCTGPGSFTGLRIGLAAVKGMVMAHQVPVVSVSAFELAADRLKAEDRRVQVVIPLNREECIVCPVDAGRHDRRDIRIVSYDTFFDGIGADAVAGLGLDPAERFPSMANDNLTDQVQYDAADLLRIGADKLNSGQAEDPAALEPLYLQKSQAEIRFEQRRQ